MTDGEQLAREASSRDPAVGLRAVRALRELADRLETLQVGNARSLGWSWQEIADALGVSRQAVHKKHRNAEPSLFARFGKDT
ncbi:RNA polymerase subunit sigma-70 [Actinocorallia sp. B10E7]|uniref:RNA polymerase subunit sigma-70 n=1 Tax=Actinocorallia sp. B10E7 TaxID=3153558 RepID=UPI00325DB425